MLLFSNTDADAGPEFDGEFILIDGDLLDELSNVSLVKFVDLCFLPGVAFQSLHYQRSLGR